MSDNRGVDMCSIRSFAALLLLAAGAAAQSAPNPAVDRIFARWDRGDSPGCALAVMREGHIVYSRGYGVADLDHDIPIAPSSVFHVASISKEFTAASILLLAEEGKLSIDDDVRKYIPELPDFGPKIALRHLLHHTSGVRDQWSLLVLAGWRLNQDLITDQDVLDVLSRQKALNFTPGDEYLYSNSGYTLLALIVERVSGQSLRQFAQAHIFQPLGMTHTFFRNNHAEVVKSQAYGYFPAAGGQWELRIPNFDTTGATSLLTTVEDFARWDANFEQPRVGARILGAMQVRGRLNSGEEIDYGFGLTPGTYRGLPTVGHGGSDAGYRADYVRFPGQHFAVICMCNAGPVVPHDLTRQVAEIYLGEQMAPAEKPAPPAGSTASPPPGVTGIYYDQQRGEIRRIVLRNGRLQLYSPGPLYEDLAAESPAVLDILGAAGIAGKLSIAGARITESRPGAKPVEYERQTEFSPRLEEFVGTYRSDEFDLPYRLALQDHKLWLKRLRWAPAQLTPTIQDGFLVPVGAGEAHLEFQRDAQGKVSGFLLNAGRVRHVRFRLEPRS
jgi:CubicO group peptidase (beta-lactamase class C family)